MLSSQVPNTSIDEIQLTQIPETNWKQRLYGSNHSFNLFTWQLALNYISLPINQTVETVADFIFWGSKITADGDCSHEIKRCLLLGGEAVTNLDSILKSRDITLPAKVWLVKARQGFSSSQKTSSQGFSSSYVWMWDLDYKESWVPKNWCFWTVVLEKTLASPLDCKEIQPVHPKGDQSWVFIGRTDVKAETPILWPFDAKNWLIWKGSDVGKDWRWEEKGTTENEMVGWHHWLNGHEFE